MWCGTRSVVFATDFAIISTWRSDFCDFKVSLNTSVTVAGSPMRENRGVNPSTFAVGMEISEKGAPSRW